MKKTLILSLLFGTMLMPSMAQAQVSEPANSAQIEELKSTLIALLTQMIADLQAQIATIIANQVTQASQIQQIASPVAPLLGNVISTPAVVSFPVTNVSFGPMECVGMSIVRYPVVLTGTDYTRIEASYTQYKPSIANMMVVYVSPTAPDNGRQITSYVWYKNKAGFSAPTTIALTNVPQVVHVKGSIYTGDTIIGTFSQDLINDGSCPTPYEIRVETGASDYYVSTTTNSR